MNVTNKVNGARDKRHIFMVAYRPILLHYLSTRRIGEKPKKKCFITFSLDSISLN